MRSVLKRSEQKRIALKNFLMTAPDDRLAGRPVRQWGSCAKGWLGSIVGVLTAVGLGAAMLPLRSHVSIATTALVLVVPVVAGVDLVGSGPASPASPRASSSTTLPSYRPTTP